MLTDPPSASRRTLRIMYIMLNYGLRAIVVLLSRLIQIGSVPIILRPAIPFESGTYKLIVRSQQSWCRFTEIYCSRIAEVGLTSRPTVPEILRLVDLPLSARLDASGLLD